MDVTEKRSAGVLLHLSSLPSPGGIGTMGKEAREFVDFLAQAGQRFWQVLPVCPTGYGDSPYQSPSSFAGNPYFIDLDRLAELGLLRQEEYRDADWNNRGQRVDYARLYQNKYPLLYLAADRFLERPEEDFGLFCAENAGWLEDHAMFMAIKRRRDGAPWYSWEEPLREREPRALDAFGSEFAHQVAAEKAIQYLFFQQWNQLRQYANKQGIRIIGDMPIYTAWDSVEVWANRDLFRLNRAGEPREVAGCPPDGFSEQGQLWGNPLFDWEHMAQDGYAWWVYRMDCLCRMYDAVRIDHFRGLDAYYAIPYPSADARNGRWRPGPGMDLLQKIGDRALLAEDLGFLTPSVKQLLRDSGYPGMRVLQFGFDSRDGDSSHLPHNWPERCVAYSGTHDNNTFAGWLQDACDADAAYAREYLRLGDENPCWDMLCALWVSPAGLVMVQGQDLLGLGGESRMNSPGTQVGNWRWRVSEKSFTPDLAGQIRRKMELYGRIS